MIVKLFSLRDKLTNFKIPFPARNEADAVRSFRIVVNDESSDLYKTRTDTDLYFVGDFDDETGVISGSPSFIVSGGDCIVAEK